METGYCDVCERDLPLGEFPAYDPDTMNTCFSCQDDIDEEQEFEDEFAEEDLEYDPEDEDEGE